MKIRIKETGDIMILSIIGKNGIEWTRDLIGNCEDLEYDEEADVYLMDQEQYEWWDEYIRCHEEDDKEAQKLAEELGIDVQEIWDRYLEFDNNDMGLEHDIKQAVFKEFRGCE